MMTKITRNHKPVGRLLTHLDLAEQLRDLLTPIVRSDSRPLSGAIQIEVETFFLKQRLLGNRFEIFPGVLITGAAFSYQNDGVVLREIKTKSDPASSLKRKFSKLDYGFAYIGTIQGYDTYVDYNVLPKRVLVFRYGDGHSDLESHIVSQDDAPGFETRHAEATRRHDVITTFFNPLPTYSGAGNGWSVGGVMDPQS